MTFRIEWLFAVLLVSGIFFWISFLFADSSRQTLRDGWSWLDWRPLPPDLPGVVFAGFLIGFVLQLGVGWMMHPDGGGVMLPIPVVVFISLLTFQGLIALMIEAHVSRARVDASEAFGMPNLFHWRDVAWGLVGYCLSLPAVTVSMLITRGLYLQTGREWTVQPVVQRIGELDGWGNAVALFVLVGLVGPFLEEVIFRGFLFTWLTQRWGATRGLLVQALVFAVIHQHMASGLSLFALAVILGLLYVYTQRLMVCVWAHAVFNSMTLVVTLSGWQPTGAGG